MMPPWTALPGCMNSGFTAYRTRPRRGSTDSMWASTSLAMGASFWRLFISSRSRSRCVGLPSPVMGETLPSENPGEGHGPALEQDRHAVAFLQVLREPVEVGHSPDLLAVHFPDHVARLHPCLCG